MKATVKGTVQQVQAAIFGDKPMLTRDGKPIYEVFLLQNGGVGAPEIVKVKFFGDKPPKTGDTFEKVVNVTAYKAQSGAVGLNVAAFQ